MTKNDSDDSVLFLEAQALSALPRSQNISKSPRPVKHTWNSSEYSVTLSGVEGKIVEAEIVHGNPQVNVILTMRPCRSPENGDMK